MCKEARVSRTRRAVLAFIVFFAVAVVAQQYPESLYQELHWRMIGPFRGGRTRAVAGVSTQPNLFSVGQVNGGVWKSHDYGRPRNPSFEPESTQPIGAVAVPPTGPNVIHVGSGEGLH